MDLINRLHLATLRAQQEDDLPDFLAARVCAIAEHLSTAHCLQAEIDELIEQLSLYDTYAQTGYIGMGVNNFILEATIKRIEDRLLDDSTKLKE
jgi:hypothetical protein